MYRLSSVGCCATGRGFFLAVAAAMGIFGTVDARAQEDVDLLAPARVALARAQHELHEAPWPSQATPRPEALTQHVTRLLNAGEQTQALQFIEPLKAAGLDGKVTAAKLLLLSYQYPVAGVLIEQLDHEYNDEPRVRELVRRWWDIRGDLARIERSSNERADGSSPPSIAQRLDAAYLKLRTLDYAGAHAIYVELCGLAELTEDEHLSAQRGLAVSLFHLQRYDDSLRVLQETLALAPLEAETVTAMADTLLRLGRSSEAIDALTFALQLSPWNARAHQLLGAGYTRRNYTQLFGAYPERFADERGRGALRKADQALQRRDVAKARGAYLKLAQANPEWADVEVRLGSLEYAEGNYAQARAHFERALVLCPDYGRAHEGFARSVEALRLEMDIHAAEDEAALASAPMPVIPNIERFVLNWRTLSLRHQKRVALSLQPWARYIPTLLKGESTVYVKPLYQLLSDVPKQSLLHDQRIDYDSRLWDDVRGVGGHHTVFGIEDIETRIRGGYDTALHEVSHQVHAVLSPAWTRNIQSLYAETARRQAKSGAAFLSQYAASSVWEYFAEGANSLHSPRRDRFDTREIVLERLQERDPALLALTRTIMHEADVEPSYAAALVDLGHDQLSRGKPRAANATYRQALKHSPGDENALAAHIHGLLILGHTSQALESARKAYELHPQSGMIVTQLAESQWLSGTPPAQIVESLRLARTDVHADEKYLVDLLLGALSLNAGDAEAARLAFTSVLAYQPDNPQALLGLAATEAFDKHWSEAWRYYDEARQVRAGSVEVRVLYARDLTRAQELRRAHEQIDAALLLDPDDPDALAIHAWQLLIAGDEAAARTTAQRAQQLGPWSTLATIMSAAVEHQAGNEASAEKILNPLNERMRRALPPEYVYRSKWGRYDLVYVLPAIDRELMQLAAQ